MYKPVVSVVIPAHNEEKYIGRCISSVKSAAAVYGGTVEIIVVCNRCTDNTAEIAVQNGAAVLYNTDRCIAKVRNTGILTAKGDLIVTIDADNQMTEGTIEEIVTLMNTGRYIGGGAPIRFERYSFPFYAATICCAVSLSGLQVFIAVYSGRNAVRLIVSAALLR